jgi:pimeloyl-ACP methyl ester carboxylesterase
LFLGQLEVHANLLASFVGGSQWPLVYHIFHKLHGPHHEEVELFGLLLSSFKYDQRAPDPCTDAELASLTAPTALLYGAYEAAFDAHAAIRRARRQLPNLVQCEIVPGVGHGMTGEDIPRVNGLLLAFLNSYARP